MCFSSGLKTFIYYNILLTFGDNMSKINKKDFDRKDPKNPNYSQLEYDLYAKLDMTIRKNYVTEKFEIARRSTGIMIYQGTLERMVEIANELEGEENTIVRK